MVALAYGEVPKPTACLGCGAQVGWNAMTGEPDGVEDLIFAGYWKRVNQGFGDLGCK